MKLMNVKGTYDYMPNDMKIRNDIIKLITEADMSLKEINNVRRQNIYFRTTINIKFAY